MSVMQDFIFGSRRRMIRVISFSLALIVALIGGIIASVYTANQYRTRLGYTYERGLSELAEHMNKIETTLTKGIYTGTPAGAANLAMTLWSETGSAKACLSQIPSYGDDLTNTYKFLSQVGEYSLSLAKKLQKGGTVTEEEHETMVTLAKTAKTMSGQIDDLCTQMERENNWTAQMDAMFDESEENQGGSALSDGLKALEEATTDFPTLIYDGPFSEHILQSKPLLLEGQSDISQKQASSIAAGILDMETSQLGDAYHMENSTIPCYVFYPDQCSVAITTKGGFVNYFNKERDIGETKLQYAHCVKKAKEFLASMKMGDFKESYYTISEGVCLINFAYMENDVVCYTDLIKIGVAMDNGEVVSYNAQGYIMNHTSRSQEHPKYTVTQAQEMVSPYLTVKSSQTAIIPLNTREPQLCYEFLCTGKEDEEILVYINANTLDEESILILLKTDGGTLTL